jgi:microfibrillar-associated protein 1
MSRAIAGKLFWNNDRTQINNPSKKRNQPHSPTIPTGRSIGDEDNKGRVETTKVRRYFPGKRPNWLTEDADEADLLQNNNKQSSPSPPHQHPSSHHRPPINPTGMVAIQSKPGIAAPIIVKRKSDDPRLRRLAQQSKQRDSDEEEAGNRRGEGGRRRRHERSSDDNDNDKGDVALARRGGSVIQREATEPQVVARARRRHRDSSSSSDDDTMKTLPVAAIVHNQEHEQQQDLSPRKVSSSGEEEEDSSSSDDDSDDSDDNGVRTMMMKPVFVPKNNRETLTERETLEAEALEAEEKEHQRLKLRREETKKLVQQRLAEEEAAEAAVLAGPRELADIITDDDEQDGDKMEEEFGAWKVRELGRLMKDWEVSQKEEEEQLEKQRWLHMSEVQRNTHALLLKQDKMKEDGGSGDGDGKKKWAFMQKYFHKGAFYQTAADDKEEEALAADALARRDFSAPTGQDKMDKSKLPSVMQVKDWGKRNRSKWTHLAEEDTTDRNNNKYIIGNRVWDGRGRGGRGGGRGGRNGADDENQGFTKPRTFK